MVCGVAESWGGGRGGCLPDLEKGGVVCVKVYICFHQIHSVFSEDMFFFTQVSISVGGMPVRLEKGLSVLGKGML